MAVLMTQSPLKDPTEAPTGWRSIALATIDQRSFPGQDRRPLSSGEYVGVPLHMLLFTASGITQDVWMSVRLRGLDKWSSHGRQLDKQPEELRVYVLGFVSHWIHALEPEQ